MRILPLCVYCFLFLLVSPWALHIVLLFLFVFVLKKETTTTITTMMVSTKSEVTKVDHGGVTIYLCMYVCMYIYEYVL